MSARAAGAVGAHAGEDHRKDAGAPDLRGGREQRIDRRLAEIDQRPVIERDRRRRRCAAPPACGGRRARDRSCPAWIGSPSTASCAGRPLARARCSARMVVKVGGMCWVISTGTRSITAPMPRDQRGQRLRPAGRGADQQHARRRRGERAQLARWAAHGRGAARPRVSPVRRGRAGASAMRPGARARRSPTALLAAAELADLVDQLAAEGRRRGDAAVGLGLRDVVGSAERQRLEAHLGVAPGQRRRHDDDEVALLLAAAAAAPRCRRAPASRCRARRRRDWRARPGRPLRGRCAARRRSGGPALPRSSARRRPRTTTASSTTMTRIGSVAAAGGGRRGARWQALIDAILYSTVRNKARHGAAGRPIRSGRLPGTWPRRFPCRTAS